MRRRVASSAAFYGNDYYDALAAGDVALTMAWSGDISQMQLYDNPDVKFVVPAGGRPDVRRQHGHPQWRRASWPMPTR